MKELDFINEASRDSLFLSTFCFCSARQSIEALNLFLCLPDTIFFNYSSLFYSNNFIPSLISSYYSTSTDFSNCFSYSWISISSAFSSRRLVSNCFCSSKDLVKRSVFSNPLNLSLCFFFGYWPNY